MFHGDRGELEARSWGKLDFGALMEVGPGWQLCQLGHGALHTLCPCSLACGTVKGAVPKLPVSTCDSKEKHARFSTPFKSV